MRGIFLAVLLLGACSSDRPLDKLISQLQDPAQRGPAVDGLLLLVKEKPAEKRLRERVVFALMEAYRKDHARGRIVEALAILRDPRAEQVFIAALKDAHRGGEYFEAAVRAARMIGELKLPGTAPHLTRALRAARGRTPPESRSTWLERALITALDRLGDRRAVKVLVEVLQSPPASQDFYLNKLAARALGRLGDPAAVKPLVKSLGDASHGLLLYEESRVALCRIGRPAAKELLQQAKERGGIAPFKAIRVLGDLGDPSAVSPLKALGDTLSDADDRRLEIARTLLRLGHQDAQIGLAKILSSKTSTLAAQRRAAELLGWFGGPGKSRDSLGEKLTKVCAKKSVSARVRCWGLALAFSRQAGPEGLQRLDTVLAANKNKDKDEGTGHHLREYRPRLVLVEECGARPACYAKHLDAKDWRVRERAALELGRVGDLKGLRRLAGKFGEEHARVKEAILTSLERLAGQKALTADLVGFLEEPSHPNKKEEKISDSAIKSRAMCFVQRLKRVKRK